MASLAELHIGGIMTPIEAIYQGGVFKPLAEVPLRENQKVRLNVQTVESNDLLSWLQEVQLLQRQIIEQRGHFPDSAPEIAADRARDE
jgi:predicted DNA-binding antitoxin AbrB/MazE fold protein